MFRAWITKASTMRARVCSQAAGSGAQNFGPGFHVYQYLFKSNRPDIPFANYDDPVVEAAIDQRRKFFEAKRDHLYQIEIFYCILLEGARSKTGVGAAFARSSAIPRARSAN